jgi:hypothetical protein
METNLESIGVSVVSGWKKRRERGWTKTFNHLMFSAVGHEGLDIYSINGKSLSIWMEVNAMTLFGVETPPLIVNDIAFL